jgi:C1A family cysteine protease
MKAKIYTIFVSLILLSILIANVNATTQNQNCGCKNKSNIIIENEKGEKTYTLGLIYDFDENGYLISDPVELTGNPPSSWDWRDANYQGTTGNWLTGIRDQGNCGSCWAFGAIAVLEAVYNMQNNNPNLDLDLSEQYLVSCGSEMSLGMDGCCGGHLSATMNFLKSYGTVTEGCFSYQAIDHKGRDYDDCDLFIPPSNDPVRCNDRCSNWQSEILKIKSYKSLLTKNSIKNAIVEYGPVIAGFDVYEDFKEYEGGVYEHTSGKYRGGHIVTIIGYDDAGGYWICKNSWTDEWGENGYFRIKYGECGIDSPGHTAYITGYEKTRNIPNLRLISVFQDYPKIAFILKFLLK